MRVPPQLHKIGPYIPVLKKRGFTALLVKAKGGFLTAPPAAARAGRFGMTDLQERKGLEKKFSPKKATA